MQYRTFGRTGWQVSEIAFGGWQIVGDWGRPSTSSASKARSTTSAYHCATTAPTKAPTLPASA